MTPSQPGQPSAKLHIVIMEWAARWCMRLLVIGIIMLMLPTWTFILWLTLAVAIITLSARIAEWRTALQKSANADSNQPLSPVDD